jgi:hypothetical protein
MEERAFLHRICLAALSASTYVNFAAVVDVDGKLIVAKCKDDADQRQSSMHNRYPKSYLFYLNYIVPTLKKKREILLNDNSKLNFQSIEVIENTKIAMTKLPESKDKYLCVCLECPTSVSR